MAVTKFLTDLTNAINTGNKTLVTKLLSDTPSSTWSATGTNIGDALDSLARGRFSAADTASFANTIVQKGTVDSFDLASALQNFMSTGNYAASINVLNAASAAELIVPPDVYGDILKSVTSPLFTEAQEAELARLIVSKTVVDSFDLANALENFIGTGNYAAAVHVLNTASAAELRTPPDVYGDILKSISSPLFNNAEEAALAKLIVSKTVVDSFDLASAIQNFIGTGNYAAALNILNTASVDELRTPPDVYGDILRSVSSPLFTDAQEAELARLIVSKTVVDSLDLASALQNFMATGNYAASINILNAASAAELSVPPDVYGDILKSVTSPLFTEAQEAELARLIVSKTVVDSFDLANALENFTGTGNYAAAVHVLNTASAAELRTPPDVYGDILKSISSPLFNNAEEAALAKLIVSKTVVDSFDLASAVENFGATQSYGAVDAILMYASSAEKAQLTPAVHDRLDRYGYKGGNDVVSGTAANDTHYGYGGDDVLYGSTGTDTLYGGSGNDRLSGQSGTDRLIGGQGADNFVISAKDGRDTIADFRITDRDVLSIDDALFSVSMSSVDAAIENFVFARSSGNDTIISIDADGRGAGKAVDVALLQNVKGVDVGTWHEQGALDII